MNEGCLSQFEQRLKAALSGDDPTIPVLLGLCGCGRTTALRRVQRDLGGERCQYVDVERSATTPERFLHALRGGSPFVLAGAKPDESPREAFDNVLAFLARARCRNGQPATFLLDEVLEFRTFESFPGLRRALPELLATLGSTPNHFALTSRFVNRTERALEGLRAPFVVTNVERLEAAEVCRLMAALPAAARTEDGGGEHEPRVADVVGRLCQGRPALVRALVETMTERQVGTLADPVASLTAALHPDGRVAALCHFTYELRLHRARGYGALKAILDILALNEPLTLTQISRQLGRTPGSTKDYLSWLEDVDLVSVERKRYSFRDPLLRVWVRLHCRPCPPGAGEIAAEVTAYAAALER